MCCITCSCTVKIPANGINLVLGRPVSRSQSRKNRAGKCLSRAEPQKSLTFAFKTYVGCLAMNTTVARYGHAAGLFFTPRAHVDHVYVRT